ncbi:MAG TPA: DUF4376 domain-containing protein [Candidatus Sulfotelmatobacter sp.]|nr:DUF4376 domain-containing protein [Candidatus Sulfotelmatobacter sp.]
MSIAYVEKGYGLHLAIQAAGHSLVQRNGVWVADDDAAVQAIIDGYIGTSDKLAALAAQYAALYTAGRNYAGKNYQIDAASQGSISAMGALAAAVLANTPGAAAWPTGFYWIASDNSHVAMAAADMYAFAQNVAAYVSTLVLTNAALKAAISACTTQAELDAIDVTPGWPAN